MKLKILTMTVLTTAFFHYGNLLLAEWNGNEAQVIPVSIYGTDDREDVADSGLKMRALSASAVTLFLESSLSSGAAGSYSIPATAGTLGTNRGMAPGERFTNQVQAAYCSGALVGEDLIMTAGHCVTTEAQCRAIKFVFGYRVPGSGKPATTAVWPAEVYGCAGIVGRKLEGEAGTDWAVVRLDRAVTDHKPLAVHRQDVSNGTPLTVIGYPSGLPEKIADGGAVLDASPAGFYRTNLDTFHGNSGSPVFHSQSGKIVGILVRGENDYEEVTLPDGTKCQKTKHCGPSDNCRGEDVTKVSEFAQFIPEHRRTRRASAAKSPTLDSLRKLTGGD